MNREGEKPEKEGKKENDYYTSQPSFGSKKTSRFWHQISRDVRIFVVIAACIVFYFALLRMTNISEVFGKIYQVLKPIILWSCHCVFAQPDCKAGGYAF